MPRIRGCPGTEAEKAQGHLQIRRAERRDAETVALWVNADPKELQNLGGSPKVPAQEQIEEWIASSLSGYVLEERRLPVAFMVLEENDDGPALSKLKIEGLVGSPVAVEYGRLIVRRDYRKRGYGTTMFMQFFRAYSALVQQKEVKDAYIVARTNKNNEEGVGLFRRLPLKIVRPLIHPLYHWYTSLDLVTQLGPSIAERRKKLEFSQQKLAYLAGMDVSTLGMVELGQRKLRLEDARRLQSVLCDTPIEEFEFAVQLLGWYGESEIWSPSQPLAGELDHINQDVWIMSDRLAENTIDHALEKAIDAVKNNRSRYYFVPHGYSNDLLKRLFRRFVRGVGANNLHLLNNVRFYRAPDLLCILRLSIHNAARDTIGAERLSVGSGQSTEKRIDIARKGESLNEQFLGELRQCMDSADSGEPYHGFERILVNWEEIND